MKKFLKILIVTVITFSFGSSAFAQTNNSTQSLQVEGLGINPFLIEVDAELGASVQRTISVANTTNKTLSFEASINDFFPNIETGQPQFLKVGEETDSKYSLSRWITITKQPRFTLGPNETTEVQLTITPPPNAEPGTHYGGILFGRPSQALADDSESKVQQKVGTIILVKLGRSQEQIRLNNFQANKKVYQAAPYEFSVELLNEGNVHSKPKGDIAIKNIFGKVVGEAAVNRDAGIILPDSIRVFNAEYFASLGIGRYTAELVMYYGNPKLEIREQMVFWVLPAKKIGLGVMILVILCIILYIGIKRYNRYIIKNSR